MFATHQQRNILSLILGFLLSSSIFIAVMISFLLLTFNLAGGETIENRSIHLFILWGLIILLSAITSWASYVKYTHSKRYTAYGTGAAAFAQLLFFFFILYQTWFTTVPFERQQWRQKHTLPMAVYLHQEKILYGYTPEQVSKLLGQPNDSYTGREKELGYMAYYLQYQNETWVLYIYFNSKQEVKETVIRTAYLSV